MQKSDRDCFIDYIYTSHLWWLNKITNEPGTCQLWKSVQFKSFIFLLHPKVVNNNYFYEKNDHIQQVYKYFLSSNNRRKKNPGQTHPYNCMNKEQAERLWWGSVWSGLEPVTLYLISVNQAKTQAWLHDVRTLSCKEKHIIKLFELLSDSLKLSDCTLASSPFMFHLSGRETWPVQHLCRGC